MRNKQAKLDFTCLNNGLIESTNQGLTIVALTATPLFNSIKNAGLTALCKASNEMSPVTPLKAGKDEKCVEK